MTLIYDIKTLSMCVLSNLHIILLIRDMVVRVEIDSITAKPYILQNKFTSMNLFKILWVVTWAWSFLTSEVMEAVRGKKHYIWAHTLAP